jgi:hypothetical protein
MNARRKVAYETLYADVRAILNRHDPVGLIGMGAPEDEYEPEVGTILPRLRTANEAEDVQRVLDEEFHRWFGDTGMFSYAEFGAVAVDIWRAWQESRVRSELGTSPS